MLYFSRFSDEFPEGFASPAASSYYSMFLLGRELIQFQGEEMNNSDERILSQVEKDREWLEKVYQGDIPQLTGRSLITGLLLGWMMALSNLYVGLKSGWGIGVEFTACILGYAIWKGAESVHLTRRPFSMLENNIVITSALAPSYITSAGLVSAIPAMMMIDPNFTISWWQLGIFMVVVLLLGLMVSIPIKRQLVNSGELKFPYSVSVAEFLKSIYSTGSGAVSKAVSLAIAGGIGILTKILVELNVIAHGFSIPAMKIGGIGIRKLTLMFESSWIFIGIGAIIGTRVGISMLIGAILSFVVLGPAMIHKKDIKHPAPTIRNVAPLEFPLTIPAGSELNFQIEEANVTPELDGGSISSDYAISWQDTTTYTTLPELLEDLNTPDQFNNVAPAIVFSDTILGKPTGEEKYRPIPFIPYELKRTIFTKETILQARAVNQIYWEAKLTLLDSGDKGCEKLLGFPIPKDSGQLEQFVPVAGFGNIVAWTMWPGVGMMVMAGLLSFALQWKTIARAFSGMFSSFGRKNQVDGNDPVAHVEIPMGWFMIGFLFFGLLAIIVMNWLFSIPVWMGIIAVILSFFLAVVAVRAAGETGINPIGAMGKVTQLTFGALDPGNVKTNLMTASVTSGAATSAADLINMLKVGHIVGAKARSQFFAQFAGILFAILVIPVFYILVPDSSAVGTEELPAPSAIVWAGVAKLLSQGIGMLPRSAVVALIIGCLFGIVAVIVEKVWPSTKKYLPSAAAIGIAMIVPALYSISMFIGAMISLVLSKTVKELHETYTIPVASGFIAGESLTGVFFAMLAALGG